MKLAQVLAADQSNELILTPEHLQAAKDLLEQLEPDMYSSFAATGENKNLVSFSRSWEVIRAKKIWTKQELMKATYKHATGAQLNEHLQTLVAMNKINYVPLEARYFITDPSPL